MNQRPLFAGLDLLAGQLDLFPTDGAAEPFELPDARDYCAACGERLSDDDELIFIGSDQSRYCCDDCRRDGESELWEMKAYPPRYV